MIVAQNANVYSSRSQLRTKPQDSNNRNVSLTVFCGQTIERVYNISGSRRVAVSSNCVRTDVSISINVLMRLRAEVLHDYRGYNPFGKSSNSC